MRRRDPRDRLARPATLVLLGALGCGTPDPAAETTGAPSEPGARVNASVDFDARCGGSDSLRLVATRVGCATGGPCTLAMNPYKTFESESVACGPGGTTLTATVLQGGRYAVEVRAMTADAVDDATCWATTSTATSIVVTVDQVDAGASIAVDLATDGPCPEP